MFRLPSDDSNKIPERLEKREEIGKKRKGGRKNWKGPRPRGLKKSTRYENNLSITLIGFCSSKPLTVAIVRCPLDCKKGRWKEKKKKRKGCDVFTKTGQIWRKQNGPTKIHLGCFFHLFLQFIIFLVMQISKRVILSFLFSSFPTSNRTVKQSWKHSYIWWKRGLQIDSTFSSN